MSEIVTDSTGFEPVTFGSGGRPASVGFRALTQGAVGTASVGGE